MIEPAERKLILSQLDTLAAEALASLWSAAAELPGAEFQTYMLEAFPELATQYAAISSDIAVGWYEETPSTVAYTPVPAALPDEEVLRSSASWALGANGQDGLTRLDGTLQRVIWNGARDTIAVNVDSEPGTRWARHASSNACAFCAMVATRGAVYTSASSAGQVTGTRADLSRADRRRIANGSITEAEAYAARQVYVDARQAKRAGAEVGDQKKGRVRGSREIGKKFHDHCHCIAVEVRPGQSYQPPSYVEDWAKAYNDATKGADGSTSAILANMRANDGFR